MKKLGIGLGIPAIGLSVFFFFCRGNYAQTKADVATQLTIYNQDFAVVKEVRRINLRDGESEFRMDDVSARLDPSSVILLDLNDPNGLKILEQNYESEPVSQGLLLKKFEGKEILFEIIDADGKSKILKKGKVIRSGYQSQSLAYGYNYSQQVASAGSPIIEMDGKIRFGLPGTPLFEGISEDSFLKPTLLWKLWSKEGGAHNVELSYITGGLKWEANYNAVFPEKGQELDLIGWITIDNRSGKDFKDASVKLMAGDVHRVQELRQQYYYPMAKMAREDVLAPPPVTEKAFEEFHLYSLNRKTDVRDNEVKQVEFIRAVKVPSEKIYVYDPANAWRYSYGSGENADKKIWVMIEFKNREKDHLGMALPKGKIKVYRKDEDGRNEFIGEDSIDHTPKDEDVRLYIGNAFDIVGEWRQSNYVVNDDKDFADESFEVKLRNHKKETVEVRVIQHLYRWANWTIKGNSEPYEKIDSATVQFKVKVKPDQEKIITYTAHYTW